MGSQLALKSRIRSTESLAKIFNAQEMIASSHIAKARDVALNAKPYTDAIFDAVQALVAHTHITHPIAVKDEKNPRVAVLALTSDRGMAGPPQHRYPQDHSRDRGIHRRHRGCPR